MIDSPEIVLTRDLVHCPSVTPSEGGAIKLLQDFLNNIGFNTEIMQFSDVNTPDVVNLWASFHGKHNTQKPAKHLCFAGHTDVVPTGDEAMWTHPPFDAVIKDGILYGRGASDMKSAIAAFAIATQEFLTDNPSFDGIISFMITGDEEGIGINGTRKMVSLLTERGIKIDHCLVGEPTNPQTLGTMIKVGRRGSLNVDITVQGRQGHVAYPHLAQNPIAPLVIFLYHLQAITLDKGNDLFQPSNLELTLLDTGRQAENVIPDKAIARFNVRFNSEWTGATLQTYLKNKMDKIAQDNNIDYQAVFRLSGESFITNDTVLSDSLQKAIYTVIGIKAELSTSGGTSDARFIKDLCPVVEFGIVGATMHQANEAVAVQDIIDLKKIYRCFLDNYFEASK